jgi:hypothetical protein
VKASGEILIWRHLRRGVELAELVKEEGLSNHTSVVGTFCIREATCDFPRPDQSEASLNISKVQVRVYRMQANEQ